MTLKGSELITAIEAAFAGEWQRTKQISLPSSGAEDRRLLFAAVAHGLLNYLEDHQTEFIASITLRRVSEDTSYQVINLDLGIDKGR